MDRIAAFGAMIIHKPLSKHHYIQKRSPFGAHLWDGGIIGPYVFKNDGQTVTVNGERYRDMITNFFVPQLEGINLADMWFQQDGATCLTARDTINLLKETFDERLISRNGPVN